MGSKDGIAGASIGRSDRYDLPLDKIFVKPGWNSRDANDPANAAHIDSLARSIAEIGVKVPIAVYWEEGKAWISDGHCRFAAAKIAVERGAEIKSIPAITENKYASEADRVLRQIVGNSGKNLTPLEQGRVFKKLIDLGWKEKEIAIKSGLTTVTVVNLLKLNAAPTEITDLVSSGKVSATLAQQTIRQAKGNSEEAAKTLQTAVKTAKKAGKAKVTARAVTTPKGLTFKAEMKEIFGRAEVHDGAVVTFSRPGYARLQALGLVPMFKPEGPGLPFPPAKT